MLGVKRDRQLAVPPGQRVPIAAAHHVHGDAREAGDRVEERKPLGVGYGELGRGGERDERAVVIEEQGFIPSRSEVTSSTSAARYSETSAEVSNDRCSSWTGV